MAGLLKKSKACATVAGLAKHDKEAERLRTALLSLGGSSLEDAVKAQLVAEDAAVERLSKHAPSGVSERLELT